jgi:hypothetical protein
VDEDLRTVGDRGRGGGRGGGAVTVVLALRQGAIDLREEGVVLLVVAAARPDDVGVGHDRRLVVHAEGLLVRHALDVVECETDVHALHLADADERERGLVGGTEQRGRLRDGLGGRLHLLGDRDQDLPGVEGHRVANQDVAELDPLAALGVLLGERDGAARDELEDLEAGDDVPRAELIPADLDALTVDVAVGRSRVGTIRGGVGGGGRHDAGPLGVEHGDSGHCSFPWKIDRVCGLIRRRRLEYFIRTHCWRTCSIDGARALNSFTANSAETHK